MSKLSIEFTNTVELRGQVFALAEILGADTPQAESLALYSNEELLAELSMRNGAALTPKGNGGIAPVAAANDGAAVAEAPKRGRGRPKKDAEAAPAADAVPAAPTPKPDPSPASVAPELPNEDDVMELISETYSSSNDMQLVRSIMQEVGGKTQLSQIPPALWPALVKRLQAELKRIREEAS